MYVCWMVVLVVGVCFAYALGYRRGRKEEARLSLMRGLDNLQDALNGRR